MHSINELFMKKVIIVFYLSLLPCAFVYSQSEENLDCTSNIENIFKVHTFKIRYEAVQYLLDKLILLKTNSYEETDKNYTDYNALHNSNILAAIIVSTG
jgi:hypothetical protein